MSFNLLVKNECSSGRKVQVVHHKPAPQDPVQWEFNEQNPQDVTFNLTTAEEYLLVTVLTVDGNPTHEIVLPLYAFVNFSPTQDTDYTVRHSMEAERTVMEVPQGAAAGWELKIMMPPPALLASAAGEDDNVTISDDGGGGKKAQGAKKENAKV